MILFDLWGYIIQSPIIPLVISSLILSFDNVKSIVVNKTIKDITSIAINAI